MKTYQDIKSIVEQILKTKWSIRAGQTVPETEDLKLDNDAVEIEGAVLYADMADSTGLVTNHKAQFAAEIYKAYLRGACEIIKNNNGTITAFDGDRVMAVYIGERKASNAAKTALQINYLSQKIINPALKTAYPDSAFLLRQSVGIDIGKLFVARTGVRGANDLVWIGKSANLAAKLCALRQDAYSSFITEGIFNRLNDTSKNGGSPPRLMWEKTTWAEFDVPVYRSRWEWGP